MRCEIIAIGTELLLGQIIDTNSAFIAERLALIGVDCHYQTRVGDKLTRIEEALRIALTRADLIITCGGLGPTQDDITREALAAVLGVPLRRDPQLLARIEAIFAARGRPFTSINHVQADLPEGAHALDTQPGTAPGLALSVGTQQRIYAVPGVPSEMRAMLDAEILPDIQHWRNESAVLLHHTFYCLGPGESAIAARLAPRFAALNAVGNPTIAFLASDTLGVRVRLTAKAANVEAAQQLLDAEADQVRPLLADCIYCESDNETVPVSPEAVLLERLAARGLTLACAESLTGGLIGARLTAVPGASRVFRGGLISYASEVKFDLLGVAQGPVINERAAKEMAEGVRQLLKSDIAVATTGVAGPDRQDGCPPGTVCLAIADGKSCEAVTLHLGDRGRNTIRELSATNAFDLLLRKMQ